ncbi:MAG: transcriptional repressor [Candidatus Nanoarchaeia archaeon]|nr:transcriptional repressor [Candidatus Nanoarchaeia archaeon]
MSNLAFKLTNQRLIILDYLKDNHNHPSVDDVFKFVKEKLPRISKKTVYTNLKLLCQEDIIQEVKIKGIQVFEPKQENHSHFLCQNCGKIFDIEISEIEKEILNKKKELKDFDIKNYTLNFYGECKDCKISKE